MEQLVAIGVEGKFSDKAIQVLQEMTDDEFVALLAIRSRLAHDAKCIEDWDKFVTFCI